MQDHLARASGGGVRAFVAITTDLVDEARRRHNLYPIAAAALGRTMTAALLLAANLKTEETITIRIKGDGPLDQVVADARANGTVRGYVNNPQIDLPLCNGKLAVGQAVGEGFIHVTRFTGMKDPFTGSVPLVSGEIAEDVTNYLLVSEQISSTVALGVLVETDLHVSAAGGFMVQAMPGASDEVLQQIENNIANMPPISQLIKEGAKSTNIFDLLFTGIEYTLLDEKPIAFACSCNRERVEKILISLGKEELDQLAAEGQAELTCHFCSQKYQFSQQEIQALS
ncbi:molecular chaperone Hsp33 [Anaerosporomusa subterranea]|uniref:33 kDa chaperonin n=1 Tax=Anaerosporomusa subterranea TaxID=1794912 RepID=A0A154BT51_ANASB|nr:Hsp33 family molecular chaperone HslO [Anaerosporomusa subterranea]KYZ77194.1 molecular chaperone Hsp33 [Anaerosporomusa subterranea]